MVIIIQYRRIKMSKTCYILGAGFSALANLPVQNRILENISNEKLLYFIEKLFKVHEKKLIMNISLEDIFTLIDRAIINNETIGDFDYNDFYDAKNNLLDYIVKLFADKLEKANNINEYQYFFNSLVKQRINGGSISIISLNWDTLPEYYILKSYAKRNIDKYGVDYTCFDWDYDEKPDYIPSILKKAHKYSTIKIMKLHGSINWLYNKENNGLYIKEQNEDFPSGIMLQKSERKKYENIIITPTLLKNFNNTHLKMIWHNAGLDLLEAERVVFLGYSFPMADFEFRYLLLKSILRNKNIKIRVLLYPENPEGEMIYTRNETENRYKNFFVSNDIKFEYKDIKEYLTNNNLIQTW
jgi:hypothetical protein